MNLKDSISSVSNETVRLINITVAIVSVVIVIGVIIITRSQSSNMLWVVSFEDCVQAGYPIQESYPEQCRTPDGKVFINPAQRVEPISVATTSTSTLSTSTRSTTTSPQSPIKKPVTRPQPTPTTSVRPEPSSALPAGCYVGGCSSQICSDQPDVVSTCEWREEYACYSKARCERQSTGQCGWTPTPEFEACWVNAQPRPIEE